MFQEPHNSNDLLLEATVAMRQAPLQPDLLANGENVIVCRLRPRQPVRYRRLFWATGLCAAVAAGVLFLTPSKSYADELKRIAQIGVSGVRHVRISEVQPNGSLKLKSEYFTDGNRARYITPYGEQIVWSNGLMRALMQDGATELQRWDGRNGFWMNEPVNKILDFHMANPGTKVISENGVDWKGLRVESFTIDSNVNGGREHKVLFVDPDTERPLEMVWDTTGQPSSVIDWDYAKFDRNMLELPPYDPARVYNTDDERDLIKSALVRRGPTSIVAGETVELLQLWVDETGHACAIAQANYPVPDNYGIKIDGVKEESKDFPEGQPFSGRYLIHQPSIQNSRPIQLFHNNRDSADKQGKSFADFVTVEIPVFKNKALAGYAKFENVPVNRTWNVYYLVDPDTMPFWNKPDQRVSSTAAAG